MVGGVIVAIINRVKMEDAINMILDGMRGAFVGALIIGVARAVQWTMTNGGLIDPLVHGLSSLMGSASAYVSTVGMFVVNSLFNALDSHRAPGQGNRTLCRLWVPSGRYAEYYPPDCRIGFPVW